ncbi:hypothetical protein [Fulvimarina sp. MAC8]|uniref:hypothetical protein n=1 Tax=Fulvimarina sp. MAC8 TaxID=3162874 RepID=UPI0032EE9B98
MGWLHRNPKPPHPGLLRLRERVGGLLPKRRGGDMILMIMHHYWGRAGDDGLPFWPGLVAGGQMTPSLVKYLRKDEAAAKKNASGTSAITTIGYPIGRATGICARIAQESLFADRTTPNLETESEVFSRVFRVELQRGERADLLRALSPATQMAMVDLDERYSGPSFIIDDDVLFTAAGNSLWLEKDPERGAEQLGAIIEDFAKAASAMRRYVE